MTFSNFAWSLNTFLELLLAEGIPVLYKSWDNEESLVFLLPLKPYIHPFNHLPLPVLRDFNFTEGYSRLLHSELQYV